MALSYDRFKALLKKRVNGSLSSAEQHELDNFLDDYPDEEQLSDAIGEETLDDMDVEDPFLTGSPADIDDD